MNKFYHLNHYLLFTSKVMEIWLLRLLAKNLRYRVKMIKKNYLKQKKKFINWAFMMVFLKFLNIMDAKSMK